MPKNTFKNSVQKPKISTAVKISTDDVRRVRVLFHLWAEGHHLSSPAKLFPAVGRVDRDRVGLSQHIV